MPKKVYVNTGDGAKRAKKIWVNTNDGVKKVKKAWVKIASGEVKLVYVAGYKYEDRVANGAPSLEKSDQSYYGNFIIPEKPTDNGLVPSFTSNYVSANSIKNNGTSFYLNKSIGGNVLYSIEVSLSSSPAYEDPSSWTSTGSTSFEEIDSDRIYATGPSGTDNYIFENGIYKYHGNNSLSYASCVGHSFYEPSANGQRIYKRSYTKSENSSRLEYYDAVESKTLDTSYEKAIGPGYQDKYVTLSGYTNCTRQGDQYYLTGPTEVTFYHYGDEDYLNNSIYWVNKDYEDLESTMTTNSGVSYIRGEEMGGFMILHKIDYEITPGGSEEIDTVIYYYNSYYKDRITKDHEVQEYTQNIIEGD